MDVGYILFAHGSRIESANEAVREVASAFRAAGGFRLVEAAFLELGTPDLAGAAAHLAEAGAERLVIIPYFLTLGLHMGRDLPRLVESISLQHSGLPIAVTPPLDGHPALIQVLLDRAIQADNS
jgi:sirohydrochlorin ferrochelatase